MHDLDYGPRGREILRRFYNRARDTRRAYKESQWSLPLAPGPHLFTDWRYILSAEVSGGFTWVTRDTGEPVRVTDEHDELTVEPIDAVMVPYDVPEGIRISVCKAERSDPVPNHEPPGQVRHSQGSYRTWYRPIPLGTPYSSLLERAVFHAESDDGYSWRNRTACTFDLSDCPDVEAWGPFRECSRILSPPRAKDSRWCFKDAPPGPSSPGTGRKCCASSRRATRKASIRRRCPSTGRGRHAAHPAGQVRGRVSRRSPLEGHAPSADAPLQRLAERRLLRHESSELRLVSEDPMVRRTAKHRPVGNRELQALAAGGDDHPSRRRPASVGRLVHERQDPVSRHHRPPLPVSRPLPSRRRLVRHPRLQQHRHRELDPDSRRFHSRRAIRGLGTPAS